MKTKITLFILIAGLITGCYLYYDNTRYNMPTKIELTPWAQENVQQQVKPITKAITTLDVQKAHIYFSENLSVKDVVHFSIRNGKVTAHVSTANLKKRTHFKVMNYVITKLAEQKRLRNNDFLVLLNNRIDNIMLPPELAHVPLLVFSKNLANKSNIIQLLIVDLFTLKSWCEIYKTLEDGFKQYPWEKKINKLFWRGKATDSIDVSEIHLKSPYVNLTKLTKQFPNRYDARLTKILSNDAAQIKLIKELCGDIAPFASIHDHLAYKYQITLDGVTSTFPGYIWRMGSGCVNLKQKSGNVQWFYDLFKPNVHYLPVAADLRDLDTALVNAQAHNAEMKEMVIRARQVVTQELTPSKVFGYFVELLNVHASKLAIP